jgi:hypothetical protein
MKQFVHAPGLVKFITGNFAQAITLFPFVFVRNKTALLDPVLLNHERIHLRQQAELLVLPFYLFYLLEYLLGRLRGQDHLTAYLRISFEREAFAHEVDMHYLQRRKFGASFRYI